LESLKTGAQMAPPVSRRRAGQSIGRIPYERRSLGRERLALNETERQAPRDRR